MARYRFLLLNNCTQFYDLLTEITALELQDDKVSILDDTIDYLKELERRVEELESHKEAIELEAITRRRHLEAIERTSDNCCGNKIGKSRKPLISKRKASDVEEIEPETDRCMMRENSSEDLSVSVIDKNALIEIKCPWTECVFLEIMEALSKFNLDSHTVQSSNTDGILSLSIKAKVWQLLLCLLSLISIEI